MLSRDNAGVGLGSVGIGAVRHFVAGALGNGDASAIATLDDAIDQPGIARFDRYERRTFDLSGITIEELGPAIVAAASAIAAAALLATCTR